jgi:hypothetical protein
LAIAGDDNLVVYGDHLQSESGPRGELIAIDRALGGRDRGTGEPLQDTSAATWLGEPLASRATGGGAARRLRLRRHGRSVSLRA